MLRDEARTAAYVQHPNVVSTIDVVVDAGELLVVMEYVHGVSLAELVRRTASTGTTIPLEIVSAIVSGVLQGLHAAHEAKTADGEPLEIVHRDIATSRRKTCSSPRTASRSSPISASRRREVARRRRAPAK